ncbi:hypothetical protein [Streptomyces sp. NPDC006463]|uniref:hypothetical protein n=1 Tax=Streptomyces sp. NPDC006463 TaxID=3364746 RepID=UPI0036803CFA
MTTQTSSVRTTQDLSESITDPEQAALDDMLPKPHPEYHTPVSPERMVGAPPR